VKICGFGEQSGCSGIKKSKAKVGARLVLASGEEDSGRKNSNQPVGGGCLQRDRVRFRVCFFLYFSDVSKLPPLLKKSV
jgi:hypothetical protein